MKPVAIFQHSESDGPGTVPAHLARGAVPSAVLRADTGQPVPADPRAYSGLVFLGGPMSANEPLPWLQAETELIRRAVREGVPVIGHCLGGQLLSIALGGEVRRNAVPEIGWSGVRTTSLEAKEWFGEKPELTVFQWHSETFSIPPGATRVAENESCANQAFIADGKHLGMQFHIEMTRELVDNWVETTASEIEASCALPSVQTAAEIAEDLQARLAGLERRSGRIYAKWIQGLDGR